MHGDVSQALLSYMNYMCGKDELLWVLMDGIYKLLLNAEKLSNSYERM